MTGILARLMNAPPLVQRVSGWLLLALAAAGSAAGGVMVATELSSKRAELHELRETAGRLAQAVETLEQDASHAGFVTPRLTERLFLIADSASIARATLQSRISAFAKENNTELMSIGTVPDETEDGNRLVGLRINLHGAMENIHSAVKDIENGMPPIFVRDLTLRKANLQGTDQDTTIRIAAQLKAVTAYRPATINTSGAQVQAELQQ